MKNYMRYLMQFVLLTSCILCFTTLYLYMHIGQIRIDNERELGNILSVEMTQPDSKEGASDSTIRYPKKEEYERISQLEQVASYEINQIDIILTDKLKNVFDNNSKGLFNLKGVDKSVFFDLKFDNINLIDGRSFNSQEINTGIGNAVIINDVFAEENGLEIDDELVTESIILSEGEERRVQYTFKVIGIFENKAEIGNRRNDAYDFQKIIAEFSNHSHEEEEEHNQEVTSVGYEVSQIQSLQAFLIKEQMNTFYLTNKTLEIYRDNLYANYFESSESTSADYLVSYELRAFNDKDSFISEAKELLPNYFYLMSSDESLNLWFQNSVKNEKIFLICTIVLFVLTIIMMNYIIKIFLRNNTYVDYLIVSGLSQQNIRFKVVKKYVYYIIIPMLATLVSPHLASFLIFSDFVFKLPYSNIYPNMHRLTRSDILVTSMNELSMNLSMVLVHTVLLLIIGMLFYIFVKQHIEKKDRNGDTIYG